MCPSGAASAGPPVTNRPDLSHLEHLALHDLYITTGFGLRHNATHAELFATPDEASAIRGTLLDLNPNMIFLMDIRMRDAYHEYLPDNSPHWLRDDDGDPVDGWPGTYLLDFTHPEVIGLIVEQAVMASESGLYDGIFFDWWTEDWYVLQEYRTIPEEQEARDEILMRIREIVPRDFLIMVNGNINMLRRSAPFMNGIFMETLVPGLHQPDERIKLLNNIESTLLWSEQNMRAPRINALEGYAIPSQPLDSPENLAWMRALTTLGLTHSDGYVLFAQYGHILHQWYTFWDSDLGHPLGLKSQLYEGQPGLFIREYTNGWAVYNNSGKPQRIAFATNVEAVTSELTSTQHALPNIDGEIYLRITISADVNGDGVVNILDLVLVAQGLGTDKPDVNGDGVVNILDLVFVAQHLQGD